MSQYHVVITKFPYNSLLGGGELHTKTLIDELSKKDIDFTLITSDSILADLCKDSDVAIQKITAPLEPVSLKAAALFPFTGPFFKLKLLNKSRKIKGAKKAIFCLSYTEKILITLPARLLGFSVMWMEHLRIERSYKLNPNRPLYMLFSRFAKVVAVSGSVGEDLQKLGVPKKSIVVIPNGIDAEKFKPPAEKNNDTEKIVIGFIGRLCEEKGIKTLLSAFEKALSENQNIELQIIGTGPQEQELKDLAKRMKIEEKVKFLGFIAPEGIPAKYHNFNIFALTPNAKESFGLVAAEASASGLPVIATKISGLQDVVKHNETGIVTEIGDEDAIARAIVELAASKEKREQLGKAGREHVLNNFTKERMIDQFEELIKSTA